MTNLIFGSGEARPSFDFDARPYFGGSSYIIGGVEANVGEFPHQLSLQERGSSGSYGHICGASLLSAKYGLTASHCVDGS